MRKADASLPFLWSDLCHRLWKKPVLQTRLIQGATHNDDGKRNRVVLICRGEKHETKPLFFFEKRVDETKRNNIKKDK